MLKTERKVGFIVLWTTKPGFIKLPLTSNGQEALELRNGSVREQETRLDFI